MNEDVGGGLIEAAGERFGDLFPLELELLRAIPLGHEASFENLRENAPEEDIDEEAFRPSIGSCARCCFVGCVSMRLRKHR